METREGTGRVIENELADVHDYVNIAQTVNNSRLSGSGLKKALAEKLRELLESMPLVQDFKILCNLGVSEWAFDIQATWPLPSGGRADMWIDCRADPRPSLFPYAAFQQGFEPSKKKRKH